MSAHNETNGSFLVNNYNRYDVEFVGGSGATLYDAPGREYLDFLSGIAVTGFGHQQSSIKKAVEEQLGKVWHCSNLFTISLQEKVAEQLYHLSGLNKVFFCNSGTEANEAAIKFARKWGNGKFEIIATTGSFHGRTMGSLSATGQKKIQDGFAPVLPGFVHVPFNDAEAITNHISMNTAAVIIEAIQGENGIIVPDENYLAAVRTICDDNDLLLIIDEVQTGIGRTGKPFAYQWYGIVPDMVTFAKGIANGLPLGGVLCNDKVAEAITPGCHGSTFGGNPVALAAATAVLKLLTEKKLGEIEKLGELLTKKIDDLDNPYVKEIRGKGLLIGVELIGALDVKKLAATFLKNGVVVGTAGNNTLRLLPPFVITKTDIKLFVEKLSQLLQSMSAEVEVMKGAPGAY